jgi:hypothetical protein
MGRRPSGKVRVDRFELFGVVRDTPARCGAADAAVSGRYLVAEADVASWIDAPDGVESTHPGILLIATLQS